MKHQYRILTVGPDVHNLSSPMSLKMAKELIDFQSTLLLTDLHRYIVIEEVPEK